MAGGRGGGRVASNPGACADRRSRGGIDGVLSGDSDVRIRLE